MPLVNIVGEKVALGPLRKDLVPLYARWFNDFSTLRMLGPMPRPLALEQEEQWYKRAITRGDAVIAFTIMKRPRDDPSAIPVSTTLTIATALHYSASRSVNRTHAARATARKQRN